MFGPKGTLSTVAWLSSSLLVTAAPYCHTIFTSISTPSTVVWLSSTLLVIAVSYYHAVFTGKITPYTAVRLSSTLLVAAVPYCQAVFTGESAPLPWHGSTHSCVATLLPFGNIHVVPPSSPRLYPEPCHHTEVLLPVSTVLCNSRVRF